MIPGSSPGTVSGVRPFGVKPFGRTSFGVDKWAHAFISTWKTDNLGSSNDNQITLPLSVNPVAIYVSWGDGSYSHITAYDQADKTHTYAASETYTVKIVGTLKGFQFNDGGDKLKLTEISQWGCFDFTETAVFYGAANLDIVATDVPAITTTDFTELFYDCATITSFETSLINLFLSIILTDASDMFTGVTLDTDIYDAFITGWDATGIINIHLGGGNATYSLEAAAAHATLITDGWTITDGGSELGVIVDWWRIETGITKDGSDDVSQFKGSINSIDLDAAGAARPRWTAAQINGQPAIVFAAADHMQGLFGATYTQPNTVIIVHKESTLTFRGVFGGATAGFSNALFTWNDSYALLASVHKDSDILMEARWSIISCVFNRASSVIRKNGVAGTLPAGDIGAMTLTGLTIGDNANLTAPSDISVTDVIVVNGAMTTAQLENVEAYLNALRGGIY